MLSAQELLGVINGRSSLTDPKAVGNEINRFSDVFQAGLDYYKPPSPTSDNTVKTSTTIKRKEFIIKLGKFLDLDAVQTNDLFQNYLRLSFRGSGPQLQAILKHDTQLEIFLLKVLEFYFKERTSLLACIKYLFTYWQDETCKYRDEFVKTVDSLANIDIMTKIIKQLKDRFKRPANHDTIKGYPMAISHFATQFVKEQCFLAEIVFLYYKDFSMSLDTFLDLANFFRCQHFGISQVNQKYLPPQAETLLNHFGFISSLILLEGLDLEILRKFSCGEDETDVSEHHLVSEHSWRKVDELLYSWDDVPQQGPTLLAWTLFRQLCLPADHQQLTKMFGDAALRCNVLAYLHQILQSPLLDKVNDSLMGLVKSFVYILLSIALSIFQEDSLGDYQILMSCTSRALSDPIISHVFLTQDQGGGVSLLLEGAKSRFPAMMCPYLDMVASMCTSREIADCLYEELDNMHTFTELFGKNTVGEIEAGEKKDTWRRVTERVLLQHMTDSLVLPSNVKGKVLQHKQDLRLVRWEFTYSGWRCLLLELNAVANNPMTYTSDTGEEGLAVANSIVNLTATILKNDISKAEDMEPIISTVIRLVQGLSQLQTPPLEVLGSCLRCLQLIVYQIPYQIWHQLLQTGFLPSQKVVILKLASENSLQASPGVYGMVLSKHEVPAGVFPVTTEYLKLLLDFLTAMSSVPSPVTEEQRLNDLAVNISFVIKEIFVNFGKWRYVNAEEKEVIGERCLEIFHTVLSPTFQDIRIADNATAPSLKAIVREGLLYHNAAGSLISIIGVGVDGVETLFVDIYRKDTKIMQLVKLSFAVINKLLTDKEHSELSPLEEALCHQYIHQEPDVDFLQETNKITILSLIAKFIFHRQDPKLTILSVIVLRSLASTFPMMLAASFGEALVGIRNAFVNKLNGRVEAVRLKIAIVEFLTTCVETQPGIIESFSHLTTGKNNEVELGRFSCFNPLLEILLDKDHVNVLSSTVMEFFAALWMNRHDVAMQVIKKKKDFWSAVTHSLVKPSTTKVDKSLLEVTSHALKIVAVETYYVRDDQFAEELKKELNELSDGKCYGIIGEMISPSGCEVKDAGVAEIAACKLALIESWNLFLSVMVKSQGSVCGLTTKKTALQVTEKVLDVLGEWVKLEPSQVQMDILVQLSNLSWTLCHNWRNIVSEKQLGPVVWDILVQVFEGDEKILQLIQLPLFSVALVLLQQKPEVTGGKGRNEAVIGSICCRWLQKYGELHDATKTQCNKYKQTRLVVANILNELVKRADEESVDSLLCIFKEHGTASKLLHILDMSLQKRKHLQFTEAVLMLFLSAAQHKQFAGHLASNGIREFLCLSVKDIFTSTNEHENVAKDEVMVVWCLVLGLTSRLLKVLKYTFVEPLIDFIGTHKETLSQSMHIIELLASGYKLHVVEQVSALFYEAVIYETDVAFALPDVFVPLKNEVIQMLKVSVALLARQKILTHLVELKPGDNIEQIITLTKNSRSPTLSRCDSTKSSSTGNDGNDTLSRDVEVAHNRLVSVLGNCIGLMRRSTPTVMEAMLDEVMDITSFVPLIDLRFDLPSLDNESPPSFGTLLSCMNVCLKIIIKGTHDPDQSASERDFLSSLVTDDEKRKCYLWFVIENCLVVVLSQASCYLRHPGVDERQKHFLKRELGSELSNFLHGVHRFKSKRYNVPPSPSSSSDKLTTASSSTSISASTSATSVVGNIIRRSPSKISASFSEDDDNSSLFRFVDSFAKNLLR